MSEQIRADRFVSPVSELRVTPRDAVIRAQRARKAKEAAETAALKAALERESLKAEAQKAYNSPQRDTQDDTQ